MKRKILINVDESTKCRFGAINCLQQATTRNDYDVPMCRNCFNIWDKLRDRNTAELTNGKKVQIPMSLIGDPHNDDEINAKQGPEKDLNDEFYCGKD